MQKFLGILAVSLLLSAPASAAVVLGAPVDLSSGTVFTFGPSPTDQFSLSYPVSGFFADTFVSTSGTAEVSAFGGFLGIPLQPTVDFTDGRGGDVVYGPAEFGQYAAFPTATDIPFSATDSFLGLRYSVGADTFYGFAQFAGGDLERFGFETTPNMAIDASAAIATPEPSTWAMMMLGFAGTVLLAKRRRSFRLA
jgi:PEP-CTERM motif